MEDIIFLKTKFPLEDYNIIDSITRTNIFINQNMNRIGCVKMKEIIYNLTSFKYRDDCEKYLGTLQSYCKTSEQESIINKIVNSKPYDTNFIEFPKIEKPCPHCGKINSASLDTTYIICGVDLNGIVPINNYENYCNNDWCFSCGKRLCKNWFGDELFDEKNRKHTKECCREHARKNDLKYPDDYCQCSYSALDV